MSDELFLKPTEYQGQVDSYKTATSTVSALKCKTKKEDVSLQSVDKMMECVKALNQLIETCSELAIKDGETMQLIKTRWMHADEEIGAKTLKDLLQSGKNA